MIFQKRLPRPRSLEFFDSHGFPLKDQTDNKNGGRTISHEAKSTVPASPRVNIYSNI